MDDFYWYILLRPKQKMLVKKIPIISNCWHSISKIPFLHCWPKFLHFLENACNENSSHTNISNCIHTKMLFHSIVVLPLDLKIILSCSNSILLFQMKLNAANWYALWNAIQLWTEHFEEYTHRSSSKSMRIVLWKCNYF